MGYMALFWREKARARKKFLRFAAKNVRIAVRQKTFTFTISNL